MSKNKKRKRPRRLSDRQQRSKIITEGSPLRGLLEMNCKLVKDIEVGELVIAELLQVAYSSPMCAGLSANQIGIDARVIVIRNDYGQFDGYINPIMVKGEFPEEEVEQCMSYPGKHKMVEAFGVMEMLHMGGTTFLTGFRARVAQHELKHLDGKCPLGTILKRKK